MRFGVFFHFNNRLRLHKKVQTVYLLANDIYFNLCYIKCTSTFPSKSAYRFYNKRLNLNIEMKNTKCHNIITNDGI